MKRWTLLLACLCGPIFLFAATVTWDGGAATTNWSDANNWDTDALPTNTDDVFINSADVLVTEKAYVKTLSLTGSAKLTISVGDTLILGNFVDGDGTALDMSDATSFQIDGKLIIYGNATDMTPIIRINTTGSFTIANGAKLELSTFNGAEQEGIKLESGSFSNAGTISLSTGTYGIGLQGSSTFLNDDTGIIQMTGVTNLGIYLKGTATFTNQNRINISSLVALLLENTSNTFDNQGSFEVVTTDYVIDPSSNGFFDNNAAGTLVATGTGVILSANFINNGGKLAPAGQMRFSGAIDLTNATVEMDINAADNFDQIIVTGGSVTIDNSTTLLVKFHYLPTNGSSYKIIDASSISSDFGTTTATPSHGVSFDKNTGTLLVSSLPIELAGFRANKLNDEVELTWQTASETENEGFAIERSVNGAIWHELGFVPGHGTTLEPQHYHFLDEKPLPGLNYYRLRQMDLNGEQSYSGMVSVAFDGKDSRFSLFPNPAWEGIATLLFQSEEPWSEGILEVFDQIGKLILQTTVSPTVNGGFAIPIDLSSYASGVYTVRLGVNKKSVSERLVISRRS